MGGPTAYPPPKSPVASQLNASIQQAARAVEDGDAAKAGQAVERFKDFLAQQKNPDRVSDTARVVLNHNAENILRAFAG